MPIPHSLTQLLTGGGKRSITSLPITNGLIHQTYRIEMEEETFLLQSINTDIFGDPDGLIQNHLKLYHHFISPDTPFPHPLAAPLHFPSGEWIYTDEFQKCWRLCEYIPDSCTRSAVEDPEQAKALSHFFAQFTRFASGLNPNRWHTPLPRFHDLAFRYEQLQDAMQKDPAGRKNGQPHLIQELLRRQHYVKAFTQIEQHADFRLRMMHHDAKLSNVLIHERTHAWLCPIDLDTVMPGYFFSDLGDMARSVCNGSGREDGSADTVQFRADVFESLIKGYQAGLGDSLSSDENRLLPISGIWMTYMQCIRFATDFLNGDRYYRTDRPEQNLDRAYNQLALLRQMEDHLLQSGRGALLTGEIA